MIAIINYGVGNLTSVLNMHRRLGIDAIVTGDANVIAQADKLLLPGVGHFDTCMQNFNASGLRPIIVQRAMVEKTPVLGICVGAQMMTRGSEEGKEKGLAWVTADTVLFNLGDSDLKIPHMGWTDLKITAPSPLWNDLPADPRFYFAHSYHFRFDDEKYSTGKGIYGYEYTCAFRKDNVFGLQFHPEKSHRFGMKVLSNFAAIQS